MIAKTFDDWRHAFGHAQAGADILYLPANGAIRGQDAAEAKTFVLHHTRKPSVTRDDFMTPYAAFGLAGLHRSGTQKELPLLLQPGSGSQSRSPASLPGGRGVPNDRVIGKRRADILDQFRII